jgi:preprotein translocase SecE subunit
MAKTRAQRKAERRAKEARAAREAERSRDADSRAQADTQMPETADVVEAELAEQGADLDELKKEAPDGAEAQEAPPKKERRRLRSPAPSRADVGRVEEAEAPADDKISRRTRRREEKDQERRRKESAKRREAPTKAPERQRGRVIAFFISCWAELKRVQWPDRDTLIQASTVTLVFIAVAAAYLGALDALFNFLVQRLL